jgi:hypothetical protein
MHGAFDVSGRARGRPCKVVLVSESNDVHLCTKIVVSGTARLCLDAPAPHARTSNVLCKCVGVVGARACVWESVGDFYGCKFKMLVGAVFFGHFSTVKIRT